MYYALIMLSVVMFGGCFALQDVFRKMRGSSLAVSMESACVGGIAGIVILLATNGFKVEYSHFTLIMGLIAAVNSVVLTYCGFKALDRINLSLYSLFLMLGGMVLPFLQGIFCYDEPFTLAKAVCVVFIVAALALTVTKGENKKGYIYYVAIFIMNGLSGVFTKLFNELPYEKTSEAGYSIWIAICTVAISGIVWLIYALKGNKDVAGFTLKASAVSAVNGAVNNVANYLLVIAIAFVDSSVQYPLITGGVMIVSTLICYFGDRKPSKRELASIVFAFLGMLALFIIPI